MLSRRRFFANALGILGVSGVAKAAGADSCHANNKPFVLPQSYHVVTIGKHANRHHLNDSIFDKNHSILMDLDVKTGEWKEALIPVRNAHEIFVLTEEKQFVIPAQDFPDAVVTDWDGRVLHTLKGLKEDYVFSGHGIRHPNNNILMLSAYRKEGMKDGVLVIYDLGDYRLLDTISTKGTGPHDISLMEDGKTMALAHYGEGKVKQYQEPKDVFNFYNPFYSPRLTLFDMESMAFKDDIPYDVMNATFGHLASGKGHMVYGVIEMYHDARPGDNETEADILKKRDAIMKEGRWDLTGSEMASGNIAMPTPLVEFNTKTKTYKTHMVSHKTQRRPQSIIHHQKADMMIAAYVFSNCLLVLKDGVIKAYDTRQFNVLYPIAVSEIPGTDYLVVGGKEHNIAIVDTRDMSLVKHYPKEMFRCSHTTVYAV